MSARGSVRLEHIWKRFRPDVRKGLLKEHVGRAVGRLRGQELEWTWALRDVSLVAEPGDATGIVGDNGSGKSTFLKILARVMDPHTGHVEVNGRVGALIEVRGGIHPELSGRENIFLYGTMLGLPRADVVRRFDEIVAFGELEHAIDRQVKFYSSGMGMRLGFSVAAFLEPDVLLVDEVLAVGDASFQNKCMAKMRDVLNNGTTLVFVSHDLASVESICKRGIWIKDGVVEADGPVGDTLSFYRQDIERVAAEQLHATGIVTLTSLAVTGPDDHHARTFEPLQVTFTFHASAARLGSVWLGLSEGTANPMLAFKQLVEFHEGDNLVRLRIRSLPLPRGRFFAWVAIYRDGSPVLTWQPAGSIDVIGPDLPELPPGIMRHGKSLADATWDVGDNDTSSRALN